METLHEKLVDIQTRLKVEKSKHNSFADFDYRSAEDILQAVRPFLEEHKVAIRLTDEIKLFGTKTYVEATAILTDGKSEIFAKASAREPDEPKAKMDASQTTGSTSSYARKYALNGLFALDDGNDSDSTINGKSKTKTEKDSKPASKAQIDELKKLGFTDERLQKMAEYYKVDDITKISYKQADEAIKKQKRKLEKEGAANESKV